MMRDGKLCWHQSIKNSGWFTFAHDDENFYYAANRADGGWSLLAGYRFSDPPEKLGWYFYLKDAKRKADGHHHERIRNSGNDDLKRYIERYPLLCPEPSSYSV